MLRPFNPFLVYVINVSCWRQSVAATLDDFGLVLHVPPSPLSTHRLLHYQIPALDPCRRVSLSYIFPFWSTFKHVPDPTGSYMLFVSPAPGIPKDYILSTLETNLHNLDNTDEVDLGAKLAQAAAAHLDNTEAATKDVRRSLPLQSVPPAAQSHSHDKSSIGLQTHLHPRSRADAHIAPAVDIMPPGPSGVGPSTSPASAMAVQGLLDHDPHDVEVGPDGRKAKRELSQSKRAAQNRAAQVSLPGYHYHRSVCVTYVDFMAGMIALHCWTAKKWTLSI